jgi:hypothetical protein
MTAQPRPRRWFARGLIAAVTALALAAVLLLAGHSGTDLRRAALVVATPRCTDHDGHKVNVARDGFTLECGAGSAVIRSEGRWRVLKTGGCPGSGFDPTMYFGAYTWRHVPHAGLTLHMPSYMHPPSRNFRINPNSVSAIDGYFETDSTYSDQYRKARSQVF